MRAGSFAMPLKPLANDRVVVNLSAAHPELRSDLAAIPRRARAARLRHLAAVGLAALRGGAVTVALASASVPQPDAVDAGRRNRLAGRLGRVDA